MPRALRLAAGIAVGLTATTLGAPVVRAQANHAGASGRFVLEVKSCPAVPAEAVRHILGIEIGDLLLDGAEAVSADSDRLTIRCAGNLAWVEAVGGDGANPVDRTFRLDDFPGDAAPRALALAGLELLAARSPAVRARMEAKPAPVPPPQSITTAVPIMAAAPLATVPALAPPARDLSIGLAGVWRTFLVGQGVSAWGGQVQLDRQVRRSWQWHADGEVAGTRRGVKLGETSAMLFSCGGSFGARVGSEDLGGMLGLGGRMGLARMAGSATDQATTSGAATLRLWGGPLASASAFLGIGPFALTLIAEAGRSLGTARGLAGGDPVLVIQGTWLAISLGGALRP